MQSENISKRFCLIVIYFSLFTPWQTEVTVLIIINLQFKSSISRKSWFSRDLQQMHSVWQYSIVNWKIVLNTQQICWLLFLLLLLVGDSFFFLFLSCVLFSFCLNFKQPHKMRSCRNVFHTENLRILYKSHRFACSPLPHCIPASRKSCPKTIYSILV